MISTCFALDRLGGALRELKRPRRFWPTLSAFAMLAPMLVVLGAFTAESDAPARGHAVVLGLEQVALVLAAALLAQALHAFGARLRQAPASDGGDASADFAVNA